MAQNVAPGTRAYQLLGILQSYAPTGSAQQACSKFYGEIILTGASDDQIHLALADALVDGLRHGNWLWNTPERGPEVAKTIMDARLEEDPASPSTSWGPWGPEGRSGN